MKTTIRPCDSRLLARMLDGQATDAELSVVEEHLDGCQRCCAELERMAAGPDVWREAREHLSSGVLERAGPAGEGRGGETGSLERGSRRQAAAVGDSQSPLEVEFAREEMADERAASIAVVLRSLAPSDDPAMLGRLGSYEIQGVVGAGGMGVVLKGFDRSLHRFVAIKVLAPHLATSGAARQRFAREAQAAAAVVHENVVAIHWVADSGDLPYFVMPYLRTGSLQKRLDQHGPLAPCEVLRISLQVARGLAAAHAQGLVHRDIKPANILVSENVERVQITDFGLARAIDDASLTRTGVIAGTPLYMSPEQARGDAVDCRSDLFSLGSVIYAMCTGRPPFRAETTLAVLRRICDTRPRPMREINAAIPDWLERLVARLHAKEPERRCGSADEVAKWLERCLAHLQEPTRQPLPVEVRGWHVDWPVGWSGRRRFGIGALAAGAALAGVLALAFMMFGGPRATDSDTEAAASEGDQAARSAVAASDLMESDDANASAPPTLPTAEATAPQSLSSGRNLSGWHDGLDVELQETRELTARLEQSLGGGAGDQIAPALSPPVEPPVESPPFVPDAYGPSLPLPAAPPE